MVTTVRVTALGIARSFSSSLMYQWTSCWTDVVQCSILLGLPEHAKRIKQNEIIIKKKGNEITDCTFDKNEHRYFRRKGWSISALKIENWLILYYHPHTSLVIFNTDKGRREYLCFSLLLNLLWSCTCTTSFSSKEIWLTSLRVWLL